MTSELHSALIVARLAADLARRDPTDANRQAARDAVAVVAYRVDAAGYNPNRDSKGRFASGPHQQRAPSAVPAHVAAHVEHTAGLRKAAEARLTTAKAAKIAAVTEARARLAVARGAAEAARKNPSAINVKAAKVAAQHAAAGAAVAKQHTQTVRQHTLAHGDARAAHIAAKKQLSEAKRGGSQVSGHGLHTAANTASEHAHNATRRASETLEAGDHRAAALAHEHAAAAHLAAGNRTAAVEHSNHASDHKRKAEASDLSDRAGEATTKAIVSKNGADHALAAEAHERAAKAHRDAGSNDVAGDHHGLAVFHKVEAEKLSEAPRQVGDPKIRKIATEDTGRAVIAHGIVDRVHHDPLYNDRQLSSEAQRAVREHHNKVLAAYGLHNKDAGLIHAGTVEVRTPEGMAAGANGIAAEGLHWRHDGKIALNVDRADGMMEHSRLDSDGLLRAGHEYFSSKSARSAIDAYRVSTHEAVHGHGPDVIKIGHETMLEEMSTEMVARKITADVHGMDIDRVQGHYGGYIDPTVKHLVRMSNPEGSSAAYTKAHEALAHASLEFKRKSGRQLSPAIELHEIGASALKKLGVHDPAKHMELYGHMANISERGPQ
jgi:hypothetical protein